MKSISRLMILLLIVGALWLGWEVIRAQRGYSTAARLIAREAWPAARTELGRYLRLHPGDAEARLLLAKTFVQDESTKDFRNVESAIFQLQQINDVSSEGALARTQEGRLRFLILNQPDRAERLFRRAIELDPAYLDAHYMLWKVLEMTGRQSLIEPIFWRVFELSPPAARPSRMREWYLSEFNPASAAKPLDQKMGFVDETESQGMVTEFRRLQKFRTSEPDSTVAVAAMARLFLRIGARAKAQELLESTRSIERAFEDPYYVAAWLALLIDLGEFERVEDLFQNWPGARSGYEYWKLEAIICDEIRRDDGCAVAALAKVYGEWPGAADWQLMYRHAHCLARMGSFQQAEETRTRAHMFEQMAERSVHKRVREALSHPENPEEVAVIIDYYRKMERPREAGFWESYRRKLVGQPDL